jgi:hypothetical protein
MYNIISMKFCAVLVKSGDSYHNTDHARRKLATHPETQILQYL